MQSQNFISMASHTSRFPNELLNIIICSLKADGCEGTIVNFGIANKHFCALALDELWRHIDTLDLLLVYLPDIWILDEEAYDQKGLILYRDNLHLSLDPEMDWTPYKEKPGLTFSRPLTGSDWERFDFYARRVSRFGKYDGIRHQLSVPSSSHEPRYEVALNLDHQDPETIVELILSHGGFHHLFRSPERSSRKLFKHLQELVINARNVDILPFLKDTLGPMLYRVHLDFLWNTRPSYTVVPEDLTSFISELATSSPSLRHLEIGRFGQRLGFPEVAEVVDAISDTVVQLNHLETFASPWELSESAINHLASLPSLKSLSIADFTPPHSFATTLNNPRQFQELSKFCLATKTWSSATQWTSILHKPLEAIFILVSDTPAPLLGLNDFLRNLRASHHRDSLQEIGLRAIDVMTDDDVDGDGNFLSDVEPLFDFTDLRVIDIWCPLCDFVPADAWVERVARNWPKLERFNSHGYTDITIRGLLPLVKHCRSLSNLLIDSEILMDEVTDTEWLASEIFSPNTEVLEISLWIESDWNSTIALSCLKKMFKNLKRVNMDGEQHGYWDVVAEPFAFERYY